MSKFMNVDREFSINDTDLTTGTFMDKIIDGTGVSLTIVDGYDGGKRVRIDGALSEVTFGELKDVDIPIPHNGTFPVYNSAASEYNDSIRTWGVGAGSSDGAGLINLTASTAVAPEQTSPTFFIGGTAWDTGALVSRSEEWGIEVDTDSGAAVGSIIMFNRRQDAGAWATLFQCSSTGIFTGPVTITASDYLRAGANFMFRQGHDWSTGLGTNDSVRTTDDRVVEIINAGRADGVGNIVHSMSYDVDAASITNATTMRLLSLGWTDDVDTYNEEVGFDAYGNGYFVDGYEVVVGALPAGISSDYGIWTQDENRILGLWSSRDSGSGNISVNIVADVNAAAINADHKILSLQWVDNVDAATEVIYFDAYGSGHFVDGYEVVVGALPAGVSSDYGIWTAHGNRILGLWGSRSDGDGNVSVDIVADVNNPTINLGHKINRWGWVDNVDSFHETWYMTPYTLEHADATVAIILGTEADGAAAIGVIAGSDESYTTNGAKLLSIVNDTTERAFIDLYGEFGWGITDNGGLANERVLTELVTIAAAANTSSTIQIPAGAIVHGVTCYVVTIIPTAATFDLGYAGDVNAWANAIAVAAGTDNETEAQTNGDIYFAANTAILITPNLQPAAATGEVRICIYYRQLFPQTS